MNNASGCPHHQYPVEYLRLARKGALLFLAATLAACLTTLPLGCGADGEQNAEQRIEALLDRGIRPNEMGMVMVLEYHRIEEKESDYVRSIENFRRDLETLYQKGYRLVRFRDLMRGEIAVPAGTTPVVLSFDDSTEGQFRYIKQGSNTVIDPRCALGIMNEFYRQHRDFGYAALFNFLPELFGQPEYEKKKIDYLYTNGFDLGNHTVSHPSLGLLSDEEVQKEIALPVREMKKLNPRVKLDILCLPHGSVPKNQKLMFEGSYDGASYRNNWALLVGSNPFYPCYHYKNPGKLVPRIQAMDYDPEDGSGVEGSEYWLRYFEKHPELRYISDGDPEIISAPSYMEPRLLVDKLPGNARFVGY